MDSTVAVVYIVISCEDKYSSISHIPSSGESRARQKLRMFQRPILQVLDTNLHCATKIRIAYCVLEVTIPDFCRGREVAWFRIADVVAKPQDL